jgi:5-methylthioadenosine/S-adenosylhomocysteine deaminase
VKRGVDIEIENGVISNISHRGRSYGRVLECHGKYVIPGFVNAHAHCYQNLMRGLGADLHFRDWLKKAKYVVCEIANESDVYISTLIAHLEMMKSGITTVIDNFDFHNDLRGLQAISDACSESGIRAAIARGMRVRTPIASEWDVPAFVIPNDEERELRLTEDALRTFDDTLDGRLSVFISPTALYYSSTDLLLGAKALSEKYGACIHMHVGEGRESQSASLRLFGKREVELLEDLGILNRQFQAVHATNLNEREIEMLARRNCTVVHNPISNMYLATGTCPLVDLLQAGVKTALGTDGAGSNDSYNFFETMKMASLLQKFVTGDPAAVSANTIFHMATLGGAGTFLDKRIGQVKPGYSADLVVLDFKKTSSLPDYRPVNNLVYTCNPGNVAHVIIDGVPTILDGKHTRLNEDELIEIFMKSTERIAERIASTVTA